MGFVCLLLFALFGICAFKCAQRPPCWYYWLFAWVEGMVYMAWECDVEDTWTGEDLGKRCWVCDRLGLVFMGTAVEYGANLGFDSLD